MRAKKSLGQHFLKSKSIVGDIVKTAHLSGKDTVLEIGPGTGVLTRELLAHAGAVVAIEKDEGLVFQLKKQFADCISSGKLTLVADDALAIERKTLGLSEGAYKVVANIPYYITGKLLRLLLSTPPRPATIVLLLQKEVAKRITGSKKPLGSARDKESLLSISVKVFGTPKYIKTVKASYFSPQPKIDSAILLIEDISTKRLQMVKSEQFFKVLRAGFAKKRKVLRTNLTAVAEKKQIETVFKQLSLSENIRAEEISVHQWVLLAKNFS